MKTAEGEIKEERTTPRTGRIEDVTPEMEAGAARRVVGTETVDDANFTEGEAMRERVRARIEGSLVRKPPQSPSILTRTTELDENDRRDLEQRFLAPSVDGLRKAFTNGGLVLPSDDEILAVLLAKFTPEKVEALRRAIQTPGLLALRGNQSFRDSEALLNANKKRTPQSDVSVYGTRRSIFEAQDRQIVKNGGTQALKFGFGEMTQEPPNRRGKLKDIIDKWLKDPLARISITANQDQYAQLQAQAPNLLDLQGWTILSRKDKPEEIIGEDGLVSGGYGSDWDVDYGVYFFGISPGGDYANARVRPVVMGE